MIVTDISSEWEKDEFWFGAPAWKHGPIKLWILEVPHLVPRDVAVSRIRKHACQTINVKHEQHKCFDGTFARASVGEGTVMVHAQNAMFTFETMMNMQMILIIVDFNTVALIAFFIWRDRQVFVNPFWLTFKSMESHWVFSLLVVNLIFVSEMMWQNFSLIISGGMIMSPCRQSWKECTSNYTVEKIGCIHVQHIQSCEDPTDQTTHY